MPYSRPKLTGSLEINIIAHSFIHHPKEASATLTQKKFDAILLDLMLPEIDGIEVCRHIRTITNTPIVMITASQEVSERILAFDAGVDDFLVKPFSTLELMARINAIYRRMAQASPELKDKIYQFDAERPKAAAHSSTNCLRFGSLAFKSAN